MYHNPMNQTVMSWLAGNLRARRAELGWSQAVLHEKSGVSAQSIKNIERGHGGDVLLGTVDSLAEALGCSREALLGDPAAA